MSVGDLVTWPRSPRRQGWPRGGRSAGYWASAPDLGSAVLAATRQESSGRCAPGVGVHPSPASSAFRMLLNPVTSTPFSVNDILRLEREQICSESLQLRGARRSPESFQCLRLIPEPRKAEVSSTCRAGGDDSGRRLDEPGSPGGPCETVTEMDAEPVGEPRKCASSGLGSYPEITAWRGGGVTISWRVRVTRISGSFLPLGPSPIFSYLRISNDRSISPLYHPLQTSSVLPAPLTK